jgi:hypothetical protein
MKKKFLFRGLALGLAIAGFAVTPAFAATNPLSSVDTSWCTNPLLSQPFVSDGDTNEYMLVPGQSPGEFDGTGWTLTGGAQVVSTTLADGSAGSVLDLPSGSQAVSPTICVMSNYPTARAMVRDVIGGHGLSFGVSYQGRPSWEDPKYTGHIHGKKSDWNLSAPVHVQPYGDPGWQPVRFTLTPAGKDTESQVYDIYVDPRMVG